MQVADASVGSFKAAAATETAIAGNPIQDFLRLQTSNIFESSSKFLLLPVGVGVLLYLICVEADIKTLPR